MQQSKHTKNKTATNLHNALRKKTDTKQTNISTKRGDEGNGKTALTISAGSSSWRARSESRQSIDSLQGP